MPTLFPTILHYYLALCPSLLPACIHAHAFSPLCPCICFLACSISSFCPLIHVLLPHTFPIMPFLMCAFFYHAFLFCALTGQVGGDRWWVGRTIMGVGLGWAWAGTGWDMGIFGIVALETGEKRTLPPSSSSSSSPFPSFFLPYLSLTMRVGGGTGPGTTRLPLPLPHFGWGTPRH